MKSCFHSATHQHELLRQSLEMMYAAPTPPPSNVHASVNSHSKRPLNIVSDGWRDRSSRPAAHQAAASWSMRWALMCWSSTPRPSPSMAATSSTLSSCSRPPTLLSQPAQLMCNLNCALQSHALCTHAADKRGKNKDTTHISAATWPHVQRTNAAVMPSRHTVHMHEQRVYLGLEWHYGRLHAAISGK